MHSGTYLFNKLQITMNCNLYARHASITLVQLAESDNSF